jgi:lipoprotein-releasing system permease protein
MRLENSIALRFIVESRKNKNISTPALIVIIVITVGIVFFISAVSIMNGYIYGMMKLAFEVKSFHVDYPVGYSSDSAETELSKILKDDRVLCAGIYRETKTLLSANGKNTGLLFFRSVPENIFGYDRGFDEVIRLTDGKKSLSPGEIMISDKTAKKIRVKAGDYVFLTMIRDESEGRIILRRLQVSGIFTTGFMELDETLGYVGDRTGEKLFGSDLRYNIFIKLKDYKKSAEFAMSYDEGGLSGMTTWQESNYNDLTALKFEKNIIAFIVILVVFVAILNLLTTIYITILEKKPDIGILKAVGYSPDRIILVFLLYGIYISLIGILTGVALGLLVMNYLNEIISFAGFAINSFNSLVYGIQSLFMVTEMPAKIELFSKDFYLDRIYAEISFPEVLLISFLTLFFSVIASLVPSFKAGVIKPDEVMKN